ncbi:MULTISPECIES: Phr family secreted Rap phosphatase inhibitor [Bacillus]|uniref:Phr family secreted Rap phosphatase inhibitor n=1 Tax=Bacillus TaxID=1386 RepID=UPI000BF36896|nr:MULTISPECIES: Phr family secreted Rap phosphatase inhibitor [Bacillus]AYF05152.1 Phr family secreted Rap phosphatase inhibitor [Bacillus mobilis]PEU80337.1 Phr family secreted Rap phosphatase inhibitor [Bacillus cereus]HDX9575873.1 Phr family secreted Rap phosphatase inhibitor [Bacillus mobilis]
MKKLSKVITGLALLGTLAIGLNNSTESNQYASRGDTGGAPARPDYVSVGDGGGALANFNRGDGGGVSQL